MYFKPSYLPSNGAANILVRSLAEELGLLLNKKYEINEIVKSDSIFCATGITSGDLMNGVIKKNDKFITETIVTHNRSGLELIKKVVSLT